MASNPPSAAEDFCNTETEEETAFKKKRSRRVSFADREITSVHYFNRDEDYETPPDSSTRKPSSDSATEAEDEVLGFVRDIAGSDGSREMSPDLDEDDDVVNARRSFLRPIESPSPGSSILGSATSNDEENFFGPVSASFIRPEQLDDAVSDDNHDMTMDSTVFSMHYRSLARSESGGSTFEEKTPSQAATPSDSGGSMVLANAKKMNPRFSISGKLESGRDSNDMSLVGPPNYSFEKLSPNLEALLAQSSKDLHDVPVSDSPSRNTSKRNEIPMFDDSMDDHVDQRDGRYKKAVNVGKLGLYPQGASTYTESDDFHGKSSNSLDGLIATGYSSHGHEDLTTNTYVDQQMQTPNQMVQVNNFFGKDVNGLVTLHVEVPTGVHPSIDGEVPQLSYVTPSPKQPNSFLGKGYGKSVDKFVSVNKSVSKSQIYEPSPLISALKERFENSKLRLLKFSSTSPYNVVSVESCMKAEKKNADAVVANLEKRLSCMDANDKCNERTDYVDSAGIQNQKEYCGFRKDDKAKSLTEEGKCGSSMCTHASFDGSDQLMAEMDSPSQLSQLRKNHWQHNLIPEKSVQQTANVSVSDFSLVDIIVDDKNNVYEINLPDELVSTPGKPLEKVLFSSTKQCTPLHDPEPDELVSMSLGQDKCSAGKVISNSNSTLATDVSPAPSVEERAHSSSLLSVMNDFTDINQVQDLKDRNNCQTVLKHTFETSPILRSPFRERNAQKIPPGSPDRNMLVATGLIHSGKEVNGQWNKASPPASASCNSEKIKKNAKMPIKSVMSKNLVEESTHNPSRIYQHEVSGSENMKSFDGTIIVSPIASANCLVDGGGQSDTAQNVGKSSERKRKFEESVIVDADKYRIVNRSPEIHTSQDANLESLVVFHNTRKNTRSDKMMKPWSEILQKFSKDTEQLVSPVTENVNIYTLSRMQDVVLHLPKMKFFELLHSQIQSQAVSSSSSEIKYDRLAETQMLLYKVAYEKARLQLMRMQREKVLKQSQQLSSAVHKSQMLKLKLSGSRHSAVDNLRLACNMSGNVELSREKLAAKKLELEALNRKIKNLTNYFSSYLKINGDPSCSDIIAQLKVHMKKKTACKIIHEDLQLWEVEDFASMNLKRTITLNYRGLFCQRFVINDGPSPSVFVSNNLNDSNIRKNFPGMDACTAFAWVLNARSSKKLDGFKSFAQETQITCSLLHNMYDVIGEVQLALVELKNLVQTRFHASAEQLQLQLCFIDFSHGWKVTVTLDLTCLNRGVYPSDIVPSQVEASMSGTSIPVPEVVSARISAAVGGLRAGFSRISRLCRSISQAMCSPQAH